MSDAIARARGIWRFEGRYRVLHLTWLAFFLSFVVWFNFAPFARTIGEQLGLSTSQLVVLGLCNVALTIPARVFIGMALDRFGPRRVYASVLIYALLPCLAFATAQSYGMLVASRLALSVVGAGFVVGIRMVSEWFPPNELGTAEGVYGGWGNFGSAAAAFSLPIIAGVIGGPDGWRWAIALTGGASALYGVYYLRAVTDTPPGRRYARPRRQGALEVTNPGAVLALAALTIPLTLALGLIAWRIHHVGAITTPVFLAAIGAMIVMLALQLVAVLRVNRPALRDEYREEDRYPFRSVVVLSIAYFCTFGSELAVVTMLPTFFSETFGLEAAAAGMAASGFAFMNLLARPSGGLLSDLLGSRKRTLSVLLVGLAAGYALMAAIGSRWPLGVAIAASMACSFFVQSAEGAVFAIVPLVKKRVSGQISGMVGAYGNLGAVVFLTALLFVGTTTFFLIIAAASVLGLVAIRWLVEPADSFSAELLEDEALGVDESSDLPVGAALSPATA
ncbi:NarK family nitrate/nitrite MFS transporter [Rhabdothermincola sp.]|mgnify:CR=1 FL=1|uniref:NarK family nitrate/nitrite MFS transporter n=1 Tax=Rhabdothermincola sp. TaxID=2820405 RepID=UPI002FE3A3B4